MYESLNTMAEQWAAWQIAMLWQTAVLIGIIWTLDLLIRKWAHPQLRYALWMLVLVKLLIPPTVTSPTSLTSQIPSLTQKAVTIQFNPAQNTKGSEAVVSLPVRSAEPGGIVSNLQQPGNGLGQAPITAEAPKKIPADAEPKDKITAPLLSWKAWAMLAWLAGIGVLSIWLILRLSSLRKEHLKNNPGLQLPQRFNERLGAIANKLGLKRLPQVILTDRVACPAVFGVFCPVLLMPADKFKTMSKQDTEHILLHELAHIKRGDLLVHAVYMVLQILYWFNPLLWMIRKTLQNLRELCCDATVAKLLKDDTVYYRQTLLETARRLLAEPVDPGLGLLGLFENSNWLVARLHWLEKKTWKNRTLRIATIFVIVSLMVTCVLPMANRTNMDVTDISPFVNEIDGARIEFVAVNHLGAESGWWKPDGSPCDMDITIEDRSSYPSEYPGYQFVFKMNGIENQQAVRLAVKGQQQSSGLTIKDPVGLIGWRSHIKPDYKETTVQIGIIKDNWKTIASHSGSGTNGRVIGGKKIVFSPSQQTSDRLSMTVSNDLEFALAKRLVAIDQNGMVHTGEKFSDLYLNGLQQQAWQFEVVSPDAIKEFQFQTQEYQWVKFKHVALRPKTDNRFNVTGTVTDAETGKPIAGAEVYDDGYDNNKCRTTTDEKGEFTLYTANEEHNISAKVAGYQTRSKGLYTWPFANNKDFNFELTQNAKPKTENFTATLPNGVTVELVGVCEYPSGGKQWWKPDGTLFGPDFYTQPAKDYVSAEGKPYEIAVKVNGPEDLSFIWKQVKGATGSSSFYVQDKEGDDLKNIQASKFIINPKLKSTHIELGAAAGKWTTQFTHNGNGRMASSTQKHGIAFSKASQVDNDIEITVSDDYFDADYRLIAIGNEDKIYTAQSRESGSAGKVRQSTFTFKDSDLKDIKEFQFQTRPYEWMTFKDVALRPKGSPDTRQVQAWVEDFFKHNYRDITARKTIEWGQPVLHGDGNISIRYKYEATIWDKDKIIENKVWKFDKDGQFLHVRRVGAEDIYSLAGVQGLMEDFFANNYRDITHRETIEWGQPVTHENGNVSIQYKYEATIWDTDTVINNEIYTFDKNGKFISVKRVGLKDLDTYKNIDPDELGITVYKVNKVVSSFPESVDFSLPENTYVMAQRIIAEGNTSAWPEISASGLAATQKQSQKPVSPERAKKELIVKVLEVYKKGNYAGVIGRNPGLLPSYDTRSFKLENGKWLNRGNSGARTLATARAIVMQGIDYRNWQETENTTNSKQLTQNSKQKSLNSEPPTTNYTATLSNGETEEEIKQVVASSQKVQGEGPVDIAPAGFEMLYDSKRKTYNLVVSIPNQGDTTIPKHRIRFHRGNRGVFDEGLDETGNQPSGWYEAGPIEPGKSWNERTRAFSMGDGEYTFTVVLDDDNAVAETNEDNNRASLNVTIQDGQLIRQSSVKTDSLEQR